MGYLLVVLAVVLVPVVAQSHVSSNSSSCPVAVNQVSSRVDQLINGLLVLNKRVYEMESRFNRFELNLLVLRNQLKMSNLTEINNRLTRLENNLRDQTCGSVADSPAVNTTNEEFSVLDAVLNINNRLNKLENNKRACARVTVADGLPLSLIINKTASFSVLVRDCGGYDLSTGGDNVTATLTCVDYPSLVSPQPTVVDNGDGSYQVSLSPECSGNNLVSVSINGKTIKDMPVTVAVIPPYNSLRLKRTITGINYPFDLDFAENGDVFVGGHIDHHVHHFDRSGRKLNSWRLPGNYIHGLMVHGNNVIVSQHDPPKVYNYTLSGVLVGSVFIDGSYSGLVLGPDGRVYGSDWVRGLISIFNMVDGSLFNQITGTSLPRGIGFDQDGNLHLAMWSGPQNIIRVYTPSGVLVRSYTPPSAGLVDGIFIDRAGNRLISDRSVGASKLIITDKNNNLINKLNGYSNAVITPNGDVWVNQAGQNKVFVYSSD